MPRLADKITLTDAFVRGAPCHENRRVTYHLDTKVRGFGLAVTDAGHKSFFLHRRVPPRNQPARLKIGDATELPLAAARDRAREWIATLARGLDPRAEAERARLAELKRQDCTFGAVAEDFIAEKLVRERREREVARTLRREFVPRWGGRPVAEITSADVRAVIAEKLRAGKRTSAHNMLVLVKRFFTWAIERECYELTLNPAGNLKPERVVGKMRPRQRVLSDDELRALWRAAERTPHPVGTVYRLLVLTALRLNEAARARWAELNPVVNRALRQGADAEKLSPEHLCWTIPAERMKGTNDDARPHAVPLTREIVRILRECPRYKSGDHIFSTTFGRGAVHMGSKQKARIDARMLRTLRALARVRGEDPSEVRLEPWVNHDIRRTVRSHLSRLRLPMDAREAVLAHRQGGLRATYDVYDYFPEKREALEAWAARLRTIVSPPPANVVPLQRASG